MGGIFCRPSAGQEGRHSGVRRFYGDAAEKNCGHHAGHSDSKTLTIDVGHDDSSDTAGRGCFDEDYQTSMLAGNRTGLIRGVVFAVNLSVRDYESFSFC